MLCLNRSGRSLLGLTLLALSATSCFDDAADEVLGPRPTDALFDSYVALGNSITAGYQSSGITDATQRQSYAFLLAQQMNTRYMYASLRSPGCPPPVVNFQTQARPTGTTGTTCALRDSTRLTDILTNVAVPGHTSFDPTDDDGASTPNPLTTFILGGETQVEKALKADPTFASIWIGNNDVLGPAVSDGRTAALANMTSVAQFETNYTAMVDQLTAGAPRLSGGVLIGVVQVANAPIMFPAAALQNPAFKGGLDQIACGTAAAPAPTSGCAVTGTVAVDPSCSAAGTGATSVINTFIAFQIRLGAHPAVIACVPGGASGALPAPVGDILVLDPTEQATIAARVTAYNAHIQAEASRVGFAYYDPNTTLLTLKAQGTLVRAAPNWGATGTFGTGMSLDGVHPGAGVHREIANALITAINTEYGTDLQPVP